MSRILAYIKSLVVAGPQPTRLGLLPFSDVKTFTRIQTTADSVLGGYSTAYVEPYRLSSGRIVARFHGNLNPTPPANNPRVKQSGWAMFKTKNRNPKKNAQFKPFYWFKRQANFWWDFTPYQAIHLRVANLTPNRRFMLNVQTDTMSRTDLFQHRLFTPGKNPDSAGATDGGACANSTGADSTGADSSRADSARAPAWTDLFVNIDDLVLTNKGVVQVQYYGEFERDRIKSVGISIADRKFGPYDLLIDTVECLAGEDYLREMQRSRHDGASKRRLSASDVRRLEPARD